MWEKVCSSILLFYPFCNEHNLLLGNPLSYQSNINKLEPYVDIVDQAYSQYNPSLIDNLDSFGYIGYIENYEIAHAVYNQETTGNEPEDNAIICESRLYKATCALLCSFFLVLAC